MNIKPLAQKLDFGHFWTLFGPFLDPFLDPFWTLFGPFFYPFLDPFWALFGPFLDPFGPPNRMFKNSKSCVRSFLALVKCNQAQKT